MASEHRSDEQIWRFTPIDEYSLPSPIISTGTVKKTVRGFFRNVFRKKDKPESPLDPDIQLRGLTDEHLAPARPEFPWEDAATALDATLGPWIETDEPLKPVVFYVAPPHSGRNEILNAWARTRNAAVVSPPDRNAISSGIHDWLKSWPRSDLWMFPSLERSFLRERSGIDSVRLLLSNMLSGELGQGIVGCDSWAWEFLRHVWPGRPSYTLSAQAFDAARLQSVFERGISQVEDHPLRFRLTSDGTDVLSQETPQYWKSLAAASRGNIGVAAACWEKSLRMVPDDNQNDSDTTEARVDENGSSRTVWVTPVSDLEQPRIPPDAGQTSHFVLHALLLHNGLDSDTLARILPGDRTAMTEALLFLREAGVVERCDGEWRVSAFAYPVVRSFLSTRDFLCDAF